MIIDRYERPVDWELPTSSDLVLQELDWMLDDPELLTLFQQDLTAHYRPSPRGRQTASLEAAYRLTFLRRRKRWAYRQAEQELRGAKADHCGLIL